MTLLKNGREVISPQDKVDSLLGTIERPSAPISKAFDLYCEEIAVGQLLGKSEAQKRAWRKAKLRAVSNLISMHGDLPMDKINREHDRDFYDWWGERL